MAIIRAGSTQSSKLSIEADGSDNISFVVSNGIDILSDAFVLPTGNTAQRPSSAVTGEIRFNAETANVEGYVGTQWVNIKP